MNKQADVEFAVVMRLETAEAALRDALAYQVDIRITAEIVAALALVRRAVSWLSFADKPPS